MERLIEGYKVIVSQLGKKYACEIEDTGEVFTGDTEPQVIKKARDCIAIKVSERRKQEERKRSFTNFKLPSYRVDNVQRDFNNFNGDNKSKCAIVYGVLVNSKEFEPYCEENNLDFYDKWETFYEIRHCECSNFRILGIPIISLDNYIMQLDINTAEEISNPSKVAFYKALKEHGLPKSIINEENLKVYLVSNVSFDY